MRKRGGRVARRGCIERKGGVEIGLREEEKSGGVERVY